MHSEPVTHDNVDPFNAITERPVPVLVQKRCPTSNPGSSGPGKAAEPNRLRKGGKLPFFRFRITKLDVEEQWDVTERSRRRRRFSPESEIKPTTPR